MLNQVVLVGRLTTNPKLENNEASIVVAVPRSYKNEEGVYETDFLTTTLSGAIATNTCEYCHKGDLIGIKGRLESKDNMIQVVAEKITFLSSKKEEE